jgi:hypothetical protein
LAEVKQQSGHDTSFDQNFYCQLFVKEVSIPPKNIIYLGIREWVLELSPRLELVFNDTGIFSEIFPLVEGDEIVVNIAKHPNVKSKQHLEAKFKVQDSSVKSSGNNQTYIISLTGILAVDELYYGIKNKAFKNKTSKKVLEEVCSECNLDFESKITPSDQMNWYQLQINDYDFIKHVLARSYVPDDGVIGWIQIEVPDFDASSNLEYRNKLFVTSLKTAAQCQTITTARYDIYKTTESEFETDEDERTIWYNSYEIDNRSGHLNKLSNFGNSLTFYDLEELQSDTVQKWETFFESGKPEKSFQDPNYIGQIVKNYTFGVQNNVFENYHKAIVQNSYFKKLFFGFNIVITVNSLTNVRLFDKIKLVIPTTNNFNPGDVNEMYSGNYLVGGVIHSVSKDGIYFKQVVLFRDGYNEMQQTSTKNENTKKAGS